MSRRVPLRWFLVLNALAALLLMAGSAAAQSIGNRALLLKLDGPLTPPMLNYLERGLTEAQAQNASLVIVQLNTPGGQIDLMEKMVSAIRNSATPVVVYVAPRGAIAGSAGTLITLAGHVSAMAPETAIGAASPVGGQGEDLGETIETKAKEALKAQVRALAEKRGPDAIALAEATIQDAKAATAAEARAANLIDLIANDVPDLLDQLDERTVEVNGRPRTLLTRNLSVVELPMSPLEYVLNLLVNPNLVFILLALGTQAIIIEFWTPGGWVAGFFGAVCLTLGLYGLGLMPVNWVGIIFILIAAVLFVLDINAPTHGALTVAGAISLAVGALVLFNSPGSLPFFQVSVPLVIATALGLAGLTFAVMVIALRTIRRPTPTLTQTLVGQIGEMRSADSALVGSELWSVEPEDNALSPGDKIEVTDVKGLKLRVKRKG
jgi:membrane-bound serine protease (ClpP class)